MRRAARGLSALLISYPKSGRTWLRFILSSYFAQIAGPRRDVDLHNMFGFLPNLAMDRTRGLQALEPTMAARRLPLIAVAHEITGVVERMDVPIIYMVRDPRDVMVSSYFHATRHKHRYDGSIRDFVRDDKQGLPHLIHYLNQSARLLIDRRHHLVSYEELTKTPDLMIANILRFLGYDASYAHIGLAVAAGQIDKMRALEIREGIPGHDYDRNDPEALRARRGVVGGFADYLDADTLVWIADTLAERLSPYAKWLVGLTDPRVLVSYGKATRALPEIRRVAAAS